MFVAYKEEVLQTFDEAYKVFARVAEAQAIAFGLIEFGARMRLLQVRSAVLHCPGAASETAAHGLL